MAVASRRANRFGGKHIGIAGDLNAKARSRSRHQHPVGKVQPSLAYLSTVLVESNPISISMDPTGHSTVVCRALQLRCDAGHHGAGRLRPANPLLELQ